MTAERKDGARLQLLLRSSNLICLNLVGEGQDVTGNADTTVAEKTQCLGRKGLFDLEVGVLEA